MRSEDFSRPATRMLGSAAIGVLLLLGLQCTFKPNYTNGKIPCDDSSDCPPGLECLKMVCCKPGAPECSGAVPGSGGSFASGGNNGLGGQFGTGGAAGSAGMAAVGGRAGSVADAGFPAPMDAKAADVLAVLPTDMARAPDAALAPACVPASADGCPSGSWCSKMTKTCLVAQTSMRVTFTHSCSASGDIKFALFDEVHGGTWPVQTDAYRLPVGTTKFVDITCIAGTKVCYGARGQVSSIGYWGTDIDNSKSCDTCCSVCNSMPKSAVVLTCM